jgi:hypothetical protein
MSNVIEFQFTGKAAALAVDFKLDSAVIRNPDSKAKPKGIMEIPASDIKVEGGKGKLKISVDVGRNGNENVALWYKEFVWGRTKHMIHTEHGSNEPDALNFALKGKLKIGKEQYSVCFGQGHYATTNNWHFCSPQLSARQNNKAGYLGNTYFLDQSGSHTFKVCYSDEINIGKGITLWAYTDSADMIPRWDLEGDALHPFAYQEGRIPGIGAMQKGICYDTSGIAPEHRDFHLQVMDRSDTSELVNILYKLNRVWGSFQGNPVLKQTVFSYTNQKGIPCLMNYGVSHAAQPLTDQSYIYTGPKRCDWMKRLSDEFPDVQMQDLVLAGSHDAGMYQINLQNDVNGPWWVDLALAFLLPIFPACSPFIMGIKATKGLETVLENLGVTQKDSAYNQMMMGTRYFDFRPAYRKSTPKDKIGESAYAVHNFIPGVPFREFLNGIAQYLTEYTNEVAVIKIASSGINRQEFSPLTEAEVTTFLNELSPKVGYDLQSNLNSYHNRTLKEVAASGKRLIVLMGYDNVNDSYKEAAYTASLTDPSAVLQALKSTLAKEDKCDYTILQLQDTGSGALTKYIGSMAEHCTAWANDLLASGTGNLQQATKPIFDNATYTWLATPETMLGINRQQGPVILLNDFVDVALATHGTVLTKAKYKNRKRAGEVQSGVPMV